VSPTVTIRGGGVAGLSTALELVRRGASVTVLDPNDAPGPAACSWWAGGMLAPECEGESAEPDVVTKGRLSADWWDAAGADVTRKGSLVITLTRDRQELDRFARRTEAHRWLDRDGLSALEPMLGERFDRALFFEDEAHLDPRATLAGLRAQLADLGVRFGAPEDPIEGLLIDCRGLGARDVLPDLRGVKGEMVILRAPDVTLSRPVRLLHPRLPLYIVPRGDGLFVLGATQIESGERNRVTVRSVLELLSAAHALHPAFGEAEVVELGSDARPAFPDNLPRVSRIDGGLSVNGLFRHGFLLAPAMAMEAADQAMQLATEGAA